MEKINLTVSMTGLDHRVELMVIVYARIVDWRAYGLLSSHLCPEERQLLIHRIGRINLWYDEVVSPLGKIHNPTAEAPYSFLVCYSHHLRCLDIKPKTPKLMHYFSLVGG
jgi:hypothetical protein